MVMQIVLLEMPAQMALDLVGARLPRLSLPFALSLYQTLFESNRLQPQ